jgi:hypothetical protein
VFAVNADGAPTTVAFTDNHVVIGRLVVDIITYLAPFKFELDPGRTRSKGMLAVPVKYVLVFVIVKVVNRFVVTTSGVAFNANKACTLKFF